VTIATRRYLRRLARAAGAPCLPISLLSGVSVLGMRASDELAEELVSLVGQLFVDPDFRRVVPTDRGVLRLHEKPLEDRRRRALVAADLHHDRGRLRWREAIECRLKPSRAFFIERRHG